MLKRARMERVLNEPMNTRDIVRKAWQVTQVHLKKLIFYGALPAFFSILVTSAYIAYQYNAFKHSVYLEGTGTSLLTDLGGVFSWVTSNPTITAIMVVVGVFVLIGYVLLPPIFRGTLIRALMNIREYKPTKGAVEVGVRRFFPMFEFAIVTGSFSIVTLFSEASFILRWWGENVLFIALPILLFIATVGLVASFLFTYSEYFIVLENHRLIQSMKESAILVISNLRKTILVLILMLLIGARIILNVILVLFIPMGIAVLTSYFATVFLSTAGIVIMSIVSFGILLVAAYLMGLFNVFTTAVWVFTFAVLLDKEVPAMSEIDLGQEEKSSEKG